MQQRTRPRPINYWLYLGIPLATALALILLELTSVDMDVANLFFDPLPGSSLAATATCWKTSCTTGSSRW